MQLIYTNIRLKIFVDIFIVIIKNTPKNYNYIRNIYIYCFDIDVFITILARVIVL